MNETIQDALNQAFEAYENNDDEKLAKLAETVLDEEAEDVADVRVKATIEDLLREMTQAALERNGEEAEHEVYGTIQQGKALVEHDPPAFVCNGLRFDTADATKIEELGGHSRDAGQNIVQQYYKTQNGNFFVLEYWCNRDDPYVEGNSVNAWAVIPRNEIDSVIQQEKSVIDQTQEYKKQIEDGEEFPKA